MVPGPLIYITLPRIGVLCVLTIKWQGNVNEWVSKGQKPIHHKKLLPADDAKDCPTDDYWFCRESIIVHQHLAFWINLQNRFKTGAHNIAVFGKGCLNLISSLKDPLETRDNALLSSPGLRLNTNSKYPCSNSSLLMLKGKSFRCLPVVINMLNSLTEIPWSNWGWFCANPTVEFLRPVFTAH